MNVRPLALAIATIAATVACGGAVAQDSRKAAEETYRDIQATFGVVPSFFRAFPEAGVPGAWASAGRDLAPLEHRVQASAGEREHRPEPEGD